MNKWMGDIWYIEESGTLSQQQWESLGYIKIPKDVQVRQTKRRENSLWNDLLREEINENRRYKS